MEIAQTFTGLVRVGVKIPQDGNRTNVYVHVTVLSSTSYEGMILLCYIIYICILCVSLFNLFISDRCCIGIFCLYFVFASRVILSIHLFFGLCVEQIYSLLVILFVMVCPRNSSIVCV